MHTLLSGVPASPTLGFDEVQRGCCYITVWNAIMLDWWISVNKSLMKYMDLACTLDRVSLKKSYISR